MIDPILIETQRDLELEAVDTGIEEYYRGLHELKPYHSSPYKLMANRGMKALVPALKQDQLSLEQGETPPGSGVQRWGKILTSMSADRLAWITLWCLIDPQVRRENDKVSMEASFGHLTFINRVAAQALKERHLDQLRGNKEAYQEAIRIYRNWSGLAVDTSIKKIGLRKDRWSQKDRLAIGTYLVRKAIECTHLFEEFTYYSSPKRQAKLVMLRDEHLKFINMNHEDRSLDKAVLFPMVIPPVPHDEDWEGGYLMDKAPFIIPKTEMTPNRELDASKANYAQTYHAANILQATPYYFQPKVLDTLVKLWTEGGGIANLAEAEPRAYQERPDPTEHPEEYKRYCHQFRQTHKHNIDTKSKRRTTSKGIDTIERFAKFKELYYPIRADVRGRMYSRCHPVSPQGDKNFRGLFRFSRPKPVTDQAVDNIKIHLASCAGQDKEDFNKRVQWVDDNYHQIVEWAKMPLAGRQWMELDQPWMTLNACIELVEIKEGKKTTDLPVSRDGVCNGTQHYAALTLNQEDGAMVGLVPQDQPTNLYSMVSDKAIEIMQRPGYKPEQEGCRLYWLTNMKRAVVKQPTMTTSYRVTDYGMQQQFFSGGFLENVIAGERMAHAKFLKNVVKESISQIISSTTMTMDYLSSVAQACSDAEAPLRWITPDGFPVWQEYRKYGRKKIRLYDYLLNYIDYSKGAALGLRKAKQAAAFCPNFIHSLDACHLRMTTAAAYERGIEDYLMVHDSYGCHATDIDELGVILREQFVQMYESPLLEGLVSYLEEIYGLDLPKPPTRGTLDLSKIIDSEYFFH